MTRRTFIENCKAATLASVVMAATGSTAKETKQDPILEGAVPGKSYRQEIPDTLDLAHRGALSINALTGACDPKCDYESYSGAHFVYRPPTMTFRWNGQTDPKVVHALPGLRVMSGSRQNAEYDARILDHLIRDIEADGLWWIKIEGRPWRAETYKEDHVCVQAQSRLMLALLDNWYKVDHDPKWLELAQTMTSGLARIAIHKDDRAWFHYVLHRSGWPEGNREDEGPDLGGGIYTNGLPLRALSRWYAVSGDKNTLNLASQVARFMLQPRMWQNSEGPTMMDAATHAFWQGHFHSHTMGMTGMLEYGVAAKDARVLEFVSQFYEYSRNYGIARMGFFLGAAGPLQHFKENYIKTYGRSYGQNCELCDIADMTWLAIKLSDAGMGDYWDDVDQYVRNHLVEHQVLRADLLQQLVANGIDYKLDPRMETDVNVIERNIGAFLSVSDPTLGHGWWTMCCNANGPLEGLYTAWEAIVRGRGDVAQVNLLLNRASPWLDVDSYLPYEGKVILKNKRARKAYVRIPRWVDKKAVRCRVNQKEASPYWVNNYLAIEGLAMRDVIMIEFPMVETTERYREPTFGQEYTCRFKGNTLVDISPRAETPEPPFEASDTSVEKFPVKKGYPFYLRDHFKQSQAPMKMVQRYVPDIII